jgi:hypothetical protein
VSFRRGRILVAYSQRLSLVNTMTRSHMAELQIQVGMPQVEKETTDDLSVADGEYKSAPHKANDCRKSNK